MRNYPRTNKISDNNSLKTRENGSWKVNDVVISLSPVKHFVSVSPIQRNQDLLDLLRKLLRQKRTTSGTHQPNTIPIFRVNPCMFLLY